MQAGHRWPVHPIPIGAVHPGNLSHGGFRLRRARPIDLVNRAHTDQILQHQGETVIGLVEIAIEQRRGTQRHLARNVAIEGVLAGVQPQPAGSLHRLRV